jgi:cytochrome P450
MIRHCRLRVGYNERMKITHLNGNRLKLYRQFRRDPLHFLSSTRDIGDFVALPSLTGRTSIVVNDPLTARAVLTAPEGAFDKGVSDRILGYTIGRGLLTSEGQTHIRQRRTLQPAFHARAMRALTARVTALAAKHSERWLQGDVRLASRDMLAYTLDVVSETLFGITLADTAVRDAMHDTVDVAMAFSARRLLSPFDLSPRWPTRGNIAHRRALRTLDAIIANILSTAAQRRAQGQSEDEPTLLDLLFTAQDEGRTTHDTELRDQVATMLIAGHETTANLLTWAIHEMARHPTAWESARREARSVDLTALSFDEMAQLTFTRRVVDETLRLYPPAWVMMRGTLRPFATQELELPAQASVIICPYSLHRDPRFFPDPQSFSPDRFAQPSEAMTRAFIPFGLGNRMCIGSPLALLEATVMIATLARDHRWELVDPQPASPEPSVALRVSGGLRVRITG